jgi:hypothetical protein
MIAYQGKSELKNKINKLIEEMYSDTEYVYEINIEENRENEHLKRLVIATTEVRESMPKF